MIGSAALTCLLSQACQSTILNDELKLA